MRLSGMKRRMIQILSAVAVLAVVLAALIAPRRAPRLEQITGLAMGTTYTVKYLRPRLGELDRGQLAKAVHACLEAVEARMSTYRPESELSRFNAYPETSPFPASAELLHVFQTALQVAELTDGAFDITVGPVVNAYGFGPDPRRVELPGEEELASLCERVGHRMIHIDLAVGTLTKERPDVCCDLSAIAKGYGVDQVANVLNRHGLSDYLVEIGGEVRARGCNADGVPWRVAIERPQDDARVVHRIVPLSNKSMATSGDYRNFYMRDGRRISHTIDPRTCRPILHNLASVTVAHTWCEKADALATGLMVLGPDDGYDFAEKRKIAALFLVRQTNGTISEKATSAFERWTATVAR